MQKIKASIPSDLKKSKKRIGSFVSKKPISGDTESFSINGIEFFYNNHNEEYYYSKCAFDGGYIKKNGQEVELWYVEYGGRNYIVRIDIN